MTSIMSDVIAGRIELLEPLARGASGSLWRAVDRRYGAVCAAKVMRQRDGADVLRFVREQSVGTAQDLGRHPHLLPPYTWVAEDDTIVLVMPLVHGGTLAEAVARQGALSPSLTAQLLRQLLDALAAMHASRWVHRDVKPANLLLDSTGEAHPHLLLADFGIALHETDVRLTETGFVHGTPGFMAPEALEGAALSFAQDVWAAAACAVEALAPSRPRERPAPHELAERAAQAMADSPDPAAPVLERLLRAMLDADPQRRPGAAEAREAIPLLSSPASDWSRTAHGEMFEVPDRIGSGDGRREVPLEGPSALAGLAPGLHERLDALSAAHQGLSPAPQPSAASADNQDTQPSAASASSAAPAVPAVPGSTERFVHLPTRRAPQSHAPATASGGSPARQPVSPAPAVHSQPSPPPAAPVGSTEPQPAPRRRARTLTGTGLLVLSVLAAAGSTSLFWLVLS